MVDKYAALDTENFDRILVEMLREMRADLLIGIPGIYEILAEHFNNDVLDQWDIERVAENDNEE